VADRPRTLVELLMRASAFTEAGVRVLGRGGAVCWMAWPAIFERARRLCGGIQRLGVRPGDRVALIFPTQPEFLDALLGTLFAGAVPVPLYPPAHLGRLDEYVARTSAMLKAADTSLILSDRRVARLLGEIVRRSVPPLGCLAPDQLPDQAPQLPRVDAADLALIQFSSGTTSDPKPVALPHRAVVAQAVLLNSFWPDSAGDCQSGVSWLPLYHDMGLVGTIFTAMERPGTVTLIPPELFVARPAVWLRALSEYGATISAAPTFGYAHCVHRIRDEELDRVDLSRWRVALCGGETVVPDVLRAFAHRFAPWGFAPDALTPVYGLAEATLAVTFGARSIPFTSRRFDRMALAAQGRAEDASTGLELASLGHAVPGFEVRVSGADGQPLSERRVGRVGCRGPSLMSGYYRQPEATSRVMSDGWLDTGDLGFLLDGELYLSGRAKDMLLIRGRNYAPDEVERAVAGVPGVRAGRVVAVSWQPEGGEGEDLLVFAEARRGVPDTGFDAIASTCAEAIVSATGLTPARVIVVGHGTLPRTTSGKLRRRDTLSKYLDGTLAAPAAVTPLRVAGLLARSWLGYTRTRRPPGARSTPDD